MSNLISLKETIRAGEPMPINFRWFENNAAVPIADYSVSIMMRRGSTDGEKVAHWVDGDPAIVKLGNTVSLNLTAAFTIDQKSKLYVDCWLTTLAGDGLKSGVVEITIDRGVVR